MKGLNLGPACDADEPHGGEKRRRRSRPQRPRGRHPLRMRARRRRPRRLRRERRQRWSGRRAAGGSRWPPPRRRVEPRASPHPALPLDGRLCTRLGGLGHWRNPRWGRRHARRHRPARAPPRPRRGARVVWAARGWATPPARPPPRARARRAAAVGGVSGRWGSLGRGAIPPVAVAKPVAGGGGSPTAARCTRRPAAGGAGGGRAWRGGRARRRRARR